VIAAAPGSDTPAPAIAPVATEVATPAVAPATAPAPVADAATPATAPVVEAPVPAPAEAQAAPAPTPEKPSEPAASAEWEPNLAWNPNELVAVRRFMRLKHVPPAPAVPKVESPTNNPIDAFVAAQWPAVSGPTAGITPALSDDATFVRRVYLDVTGMIPSADEAKKFVEDKSPDKRVKLVDALLDRGEEYAANWVPFWEDALASNGNHQGGVGTHGNYRAWILESFKANKPYDHMVTELIDPTMPGNPGRYVLNQDHTRTVQTASDVAQVFLRTAIKCASCHNNFENKAWPQTRAAAFAGFFGPKDLELIRCEVKSGQFVPTEFMFDLPAAPKGAPEDQAARLKRVAQLLTDPTNPQFAKTIVNRLWKRYLGLGLFEPVDDYRDDRPGNHEALLAWLADDLIRHGFNLKRTTNLILTSRTYQLAYDPRLEDPFDVDKPDEARYFRSPALRRLTAEQLLDSVKTGVDGRPVDAARAYRDDESTPLTRALGRPATRNEVSTARPDDAAVVQALELLNGPEYAERIYKGELTNALAIMPDAKQVVEQAYWSVLSRAPGEAELEAGVTFLSAAPKPATTQPISLTWVDDAPPPGSKASPGWKWAGASEVPPFSGQLSHTQATVPNEEEPKAPKQHLFTGASFAVNKGDTLFAYVFIDAVHPTRQIMLQFHEAGGDWNRRATWGEQVIAFQPQTHLGPLPAAGEWVRLEIPAEKIGFGDGVTKIDGLSFDQVGGRVYWDKVGVIKGNAVHAPETIGDMLWALMTSPEFQYVR
jgi:hypothetical protein